MIVTSRMVYFRGINPLQLPVLEDLVKSIWRYLLPYILVDLVTVTTLR